MSFINSISLQISSIGKFWQEKFNHQVFRWNLIFIFFQLAFLVYKFNDLPQQVPLYYSLPWGEAQLTSASSLFLLPTFSIAIGLINNLLAAFFIKLVPLLSRLLMIFSLLFSILSSIAIFQIINLIS